MNKRIQQITIVLGLALALAVVMSPLAMAEITQVQMGVDGMI